MGSGQFLQQQAVSALSRGQTAQAKLLFEQILNIDPEEPDALHGMGMVALLSGQLAPAEGFLRRAVRARPESAFFHTNLGEVLRQRGQLDDAVATLRRALELCPDSIDAMYNLGVALQSQGRVADAIHEYQQVVAARPMPAAWCNLGNAMMALQRADDAHRCYAQAIAIDPNHVESLRNLGIMLQNDGRYADAAALFQRSLGIGGDRAETLDNLGASLQSLGRIQDAILCHQRAIQMDPRFAVAHNNLGNAFVQLNAMEQAIACYKNALALDRRSGDAWYNLGSVYQALGWQDEALDAYTHAAELIPYLPATQNNLGNVLKDQARLDEALEHFRKASALAPHIHHIYSNILFTTLYREEDPKLILDAHIKWASVQADPLLATVKPFTNDRDPNRRIRLGYVSANLRHQTLGMLMEPIVQQHDKSRFELFIYYDAPVADDRTQRYRAVADHWREVANLGDRELADLIRRDRIDLLVDLSAHMAGTRLMTFARRPAPVQASYMAYPATTGARAIDWLITDTFLDPPDPPGAPAPAEPRAVERLARLPKSYWAYAPNDGTPDVGQLPASKNGFVTFGSLNNFCKTSQGTVNRWARVLDTVPNSNLRVLTVGKLAHNRWPEQWFKQSGIDPSRVTFLEYAPRFDYLNYYNAIDIVLDTSPCNGHTTTLDALWMGAPVVTFATRHAFGRAGLSILTNLGLPELVTWSDDDYVRIASELAGDLPRLSTLRASLRDRFQRSPLHDTARLTRELEDLYQDMWRDWCTSDKVSAAPPLSDQPTLSICITVKDRSRRTIEDGRTLELLPNCVRSLVAALPVDESIELVITDYGSTDWPLEQWIAGVAGGAPGMRVKIVPVDGSFSRGQGLNAAARAATGKILFFCDADMIIPPGMLAEGLEHARLGKAFFPICTLTDAAGKPFTRCATGFGLAFVSREVFEKSGGWPEFQSWGGEDDLFWDRCYRVACTERYAVAGLMHQWHPERWKSESYSRQTLADWQESGAARAGPAPRQSAPLSSSPRVLLLARHDISHLSRQTPGQTWTWDGVRFTLDPTEPSDYIVGLNGLPDRLPPWSSQIEAKNIWIVVQEPPVGALRTLHAGQQSAHRVFMQESEFAGSRHHLSHGALPWGVGRTFDELVALQQPPPGKRDRLSWITSNLKQLPGQVQRLTFLESILGKIDFDLFGRGFQFVENKWDALAPYRYALAIENFSGPHYWTEKIADCFLAWTMPIYWGCTNIDSYFPAGSFIRIDIQRPEEALEIIRSAMSEDRWSRSLPAIEEARRLILHRHQLFPFLVQQIRQGNPLIRVAEEGMGGDRSKR